MEAAEGPEQGAFDSFHGAALLRLAIIVSFEMEHGVNEVSRQLGLPGDTELAGLADCFLDADKDLSVDCDRRAWFRVIEGNDIRRSGVAEEGFVELGHLGVGDQVNPDIILLETEQPQQSGRDRPELA